MYVCEEGVYHEDTATTYSLEDIILCHIIGRISSCIRSTNPAANFFFPRFIRPPQSTLDWLITCYRTVFHGSIAVGFLLCCRPLFELAHAHDEQCGVKLRARDPKTNMDNIRWIDRRITFIFSHHLPLLLLLGGGRHLFSLSL